VHSHERRSPGVCAGEGDIVPSLLGTGNTEEGGTMKTISFLVINLCFCSRVQLYKVRVCRLLKRAKSLYGI